MSESIAVILVSGFLGAGKTTLMRRLIQDAGQRGLRLSVIVNEFGIADVDSNILREADADLLSSVAGGCACCSGQEEFLYSLIEIAERKDEKRPQIILIESSGLADPVLMLDAMTIAKLLPHLRVTSLIAVVDSSRILHIAEEAMPLLLRQVKLADRIVLNKIDIAFRSEDRNGARLPEIEELMRTANPTAHIEAAKGCDIPLDDLWARALSGDRKDFSGDAGPEAPHAHYQTAVVPLREPVSRVRFEAALQGLGANVWRAKGFVRFSGSEGLFLMQYTGGGGGRYEIQPFDASLFGTPETSLVFIGPRLDYAQLSGDFTGIMPLQVV